MASVPKFTWTQPVGGKVVVWRPLKMGDHIDLDANYGKTNVAHLKKYAQYALRILQVGDASPRQFDVNDFREWDEYDFDQFVEEVATQEAVRANALSSTRPGSPVKVLDEAITQAQIDLNKVAESLRNVLASAKALEQKTGPLDSPPT
jgi:hypothetical protein